MMGDQKGKAKHDRELAAIGAIIDALNGLDGESIRRVLDYVFSRLSITAPTHMKAVTMANVSPSIGGVDIPHRVPASESSPRILSLRDLKEQKQPESSNQMAALVAYYLSDVVTDAEHKAAITTSDVEKYFKQAAFHLPKSPSQTLRNATAVGYLDSIGNGLYKLNPVGYNLVVHGLPRSHTTATKKKRKPSRQSTQPKRKA